MNPHKRKKLAKIEKYKESLRQKEIEESKTTIIQEEKKIDLIVEKPIEKESEKPLETVVANTDSVQPESKILKKKKTVNDPV